MTKYVECQTNDLEKILMNLQKLFLVSYAIFHFIYIYLITMTARLAFLWLLYLNFTTTADEISSKESV